jgi:hypothetical protein
MEKTGVREGVRPHARLFLLDFYLGLSMFKSTFRQWLIVREESLLVKV